MPKTLTQCPRCNGSGSVYSSFEAAANDALAKKCDELEAENADLKCRLDVLHRIFLDYSIESDTTLRDVCERLTSANVGLQEENQRLKRLIRAQEDALPHTELPAADEPYEIPQVVGCVASAVERAAGKVSGPAQAALMALAVELRRGT